MKFRKSAPLKGEITVPGDKSISHRSVMLGAISKGTTSITNFLEGADCLSTIDCFRKMGIEVERKPEEILIMGFTKDELIRIAEGLGVAIVAILVIVLVIRPLINNAFDATPRGTEARLLGENAEEDNLLLHLVKIYRNKWVHIASHFDGRSDSNVKNRWYTHFQATMPDQHPAPPPLENNSGDEPEMPMD